MIPSAAGLMDLFVRFVEPQVILLAALIFYPLERVLPRRREQRALRRRWRTDAIYLLLNGVLIRLALVPVIAGLVIARSRLGDPLGLSQAPLALQFVLALVVADLGFYLMHRLQHAAPALWRLHAIHHSIEDLDWLASFRVHPIDQVLTTSAALAPIMLLGVSDPAIALYGLVYRWHSILLHANVDVRLGALGRVIATPAFHHVHHRRDWRESNSNFAGQLSAWDMLFGTFHKASGDAVAAYGLEAEMPGGYVDQLAKPFRRSA